MNKRTFFCFLVDGAERAKEGTISIECCSKASDMSPRDICLFRLSVPAKNSIIIYLWGTDFLA